MLLAAAALAGCTGEDGARVTPGAAARPSATPALTTEALQAAVGVDGIRAHLEELQRIAAANGGNRAVGTPGYDASADYVMEQLTAAGYTPSRQRFDVHQFEERSPALLEVGAVRPPLRSGMDFSTMEFSPGGDVTGPLAAVDLRLPPDETTSTSGCERGDFAGFPRGAVALMQRGTCPFAGKVRNAEQAGAVAALVFNEGQPGRRALDQGSLGEPGVGIPALSLGFRAGERLAAAEGEPTRVVTDTVSESLPTSNVIAETPGGNADEVVMVGAHLDSVPVGPGINDNGSGVGTVLEIARALAAETPGNKVRFAFWGAEEPGLLGSQHYAETLPAADAERIAAYLNFDMLASPNYTRMVYASEGAPPGSAAIEEVFRDWFAAEELPVDTVDLVGRSDHAALAARGIPVGGLFSGAEDLEETPTAGEPGGLGQPRDGCYHQACDTLENIDPDALDALSDAAAHTVATLAASTEGVERGRGG